MLVNRLTPQQVAPSLPPIQPTRLTAIPVTALPINILLDMAESHAISAQHSAPRTLSVDGLGSGGESDCDFAPETAADAPEEEQESSEYSDEGMDSSVSCSSSPEEESEAESESEPPEQSDTDTDMSGEAVSVHEMNPADLYTSFVYVCGIDMLLDGKRLDAETGLYRPVPLRERSDAHTDQYYHLGMSCLADPASPIYDSDCAQEVLQASTLLEQHTQFCDEHFASGRHLNGLARVVDRALSWEQCDSPMEVNFTYYCEKRRQFTHQKHNLSVAAQALLPSVWFCVNIRTNVKCKLFYIFRTEPPLIEDGQVETVFQCVNRIFREHETLAHDLWTEYAEHKRTVVAAQSL